MNILYAINSSQPGGAEQHVLDLVNGMVTNGHQVFVWCPEGIMAVRYEIAGADVVRIKIGPDIDFTYITALTKFLKEKKIDILHAHELKAVGNALIAGFLARTKVRISHTHTPISEWQIPAWKKFVNIKFFYSPIVNLLTTKEIALTESRMEVKLREGIKRNKLEIIPNGVDLQRFVPVHKEKSPGEPYIFGYLGRLTVEKGVPVLLEAFSKLMQRAKIEPWEIKLVIAGGGVLEEDLKKKTRELLLEDNIGFLGTFAEEDKVSIYNSFDAFIFPSLAEGFGIVLIEAMAMELPAIASDLPPLEEIGGSTVIFFEAGNSEDLAEKMYNLYLKKDKIRNLAVEERRRVEELFSMEKFIISYQNLYERLMEEKK